MKIKLFYSYSHKDQEFRKDLEMSLAVLRNNQLIEEWHDKKISFNSFTNIICNIYKKKN
jgi:hypothetical protein